MSRLQQLRTEIDKVDKNLVQLLEQRLAISEKIAEIKKEENRPVCDKERERQKLMMIKELSAEEYADSIERTFAFLIEESKRIQEKK